METPEEIYYKFKKDYEDLKAKVQINTIRIIALEQLDTLTHKEITKLKEKYDEKQTSDTL